MSKASSEEAVVLRFHRERNCIDAVVQSGSDEEKQYVTTLRLEAVLLCSCNGNQMRDSKCKHLRAALEQMDEKELRQFILDAHRIPPGVPS